MIKNCGITFHPRWWTISRKFYLMDKKIFGDESPEVECKAQQILFCSLKYLYDDPSISGKKMVVIRWNPHGYVVPDGYTKLKKSERLAFKLKLRQAPPKDLISVFYICYDQDNPLICKNYPVHMIYGIEDINEKMLLHS